MALPGANPMPTPNPSHNFYVLVSKALYLLEKPVDLMLHWLLWQEVANDQGGSMRGPESAIK